MVAFISVVFVVDADSRIDRDRTISGRECGERVDIQILNLWILAYHSVDAQNGLDQCLFVSRRRAAEALEERSAAYLFQHVVCIQVRQRMDSETRHLSRVRR
jgi:hypothetical protein